MTDSTPRVSAERLTLLLHRPISEMLDEIDAVNVLLDLRDARAELEKVTAERDRARSAYGHACDARNETMAERDAAIRERDVSEQHDAMWREEYAAENTKLRAEIARLNSMVGALREALIMQGDRCRSCKYLLSWSISDCDAHRVLADTAAAGEAWAARLRAEGRQAGLEEAVNICDCTLALGKATGAGIEAVGYVADGLRTLVTAPPLEEK